ncbi:COBRA-like protein 6 [Capsicum annuum]|uniref:COBRA-like protein 6 n=1 Tax=Capsicum annuum TaxID=4072 RepID=A0A2G2YLB2_CAPAN|nr:COBRA-like protein 6 [Capsicum annuum]
MTQDLGRYGTSFEMGIGSASDDGSGPRILENFTFGIPSYTYGQPFPVPPRKFSVDKGRRKTKEVAMWDVICTYSEYRASSSPTCCVSLSAFYSKTIVPFSICSCGFQGQLAANQFNDGNESLNAIDIPSSRPKKEPLYPYPRKMIDSPVANKVVSEQPVWKLRWRWHGKEVTWDMRGAETTEQGDCSAVRGSPQCCEKEPVIVDLLPRVSYNMQTANCCKGRVLTSMTQDPERYGASFEMGIGSASDDGSSPRIPENFILGIPRYTYGQPFPVPPSKFSVDKGRRKTKAVGKYTKL